jgi:hypothetical protein
MTQEEIIDMARHIANMFGTRMCDENGDTHGEELYAMGIDDIVNAIKLVAAKERDACWKIACEYTQLLQSHTCLKVADAIRARGEA